MKNIFLLCFSILTAFSLQISHANEPKNISLIKANLVRYHDSGEYQKDQAKVIANAMAYLKTRIDNQKNQKNQKSEPKKLAIVLDIDETALSNYNDMVALDFGGTMRQINDAEGNGSDPAIAPTLELYRYAKSNNVAVFFVTGRTERYRAATEKNLVDAGFTNRDDLYLKPEDYHAKTAAIYKTNIRCQIEKQGYDIVLNIGDQLSDLSGGCADKGFKLPNPYYLVP